MATIAKQSIYLNLRPGSVMPVLHVSQGDSGLEALEFKLINGSQPWPIPAAVTDIQLNGTTPVGVFSYSDPTWSGNTVTANVTETMTAERGLTLCELRFLDSTLNSIGTLNFVIAVEPSPFTNAHVSTSDMAVIIESLNGSQRNMLLSKSWAVGNTGMRDGEDTNNSKYWSEVSDDNGQRWAIGSINGTAVPTTDPAYHNNSKYWSEQSDINGERWSVGQIDGSDVPSSDVTYHNNSKWWSSISESWAVGGTGNRTGENTNNSKYYADQSRIEGNGLASVFSDALDYSAGDYVIHDGILYEFTVDHSAGAWNLSDVHVVNMGDEVVDLKNGIDNVNTKTDRLRKHILFPAAYPAKGAGYDCPKSLTLPQGGCFANGHFLLYFTNSGDSAGQVKFLDATGVEVGNQSINLNHGNDLTYDYDHSLVYAVVGSTVKAYTFDTANYTLTLSDTITPAIAVHGLAYIGDGKFAAYSIADNALYLLDNTMQSATLVINNVYPGADHVNAWYHQGIAYDGNGYIYVAARDKVNDGTNVIFVYDIAEPSVGAYVGTICYPRGAIELEWVDFYDDLMYAGFLADNLTEIVRADYYRNEYGALQRSYSLYGKTSPNYLYFDDTATNRFATGLEPSANAIANNEYFMHLLLLTENSAARFVSTTKNVQLNGFYGVIRNDDASLDSLSLSNCVVTMYNVLATNELTLVSSKVNGRINAVQGTINNSEAPLSYIRSGIVNRSIIGVYPKQNDTQVLSFKNDAYPIINGNRYDTRMNPMTEQNFHPFLTGMCATYNFFPITTTYTRFELSDAIPLSAFMVIPLPSVSITGFDYYYAVEEDVPVLYMKAAETKNASILLLAIF